MRKAMRVTGSTKPVQVLRSFCLPGDTTVPKNMLLVPQS